MGMQLSGADDLKNDLAIMAGALGDDGTTNAKILKGAAQPILEQMIQNASTDPRPRSGLLRGSLRIRAGSRIHGAARKVTIWFGGGGDIDDKIVQRMRRVLEEDIQYGYLQEGAMKHLQEARIIARRAGILSSTITGEGGRLMVHPWLGTRKMKTLAVLLKTAFREPLGLYSVDQKMLFLDLQRDPAAGNFSEKLKELLSTVDENDIIFDSFSDNELTIDRYDPQVPRELLEKAYVRNVLDISG